MKGILDVILSTLAAGIIEKVEPKIEVKVPSSQQYSVIGDALKSLAVKSLDLDSTRLPIIDNIKQNIPEIGDILNIVEHLISNIKLPEPRLDNQNNQNDSHFNRIINELKEIMKELLLEISGISDANIEIIHNTVNIILLLDEKMSEKDFAELAVSATGTGSLGINGVGAAGVPANSNKGTYSEAEEFNESLRNANILLYKIFFKKYDRESEFAKKIALISLFTGIKNVIEHYKDYIKENPNPLISKYLDKMEKILPNINPNDRKNNFSKYQFVSIVGLLMNINYMLCYTSSLGNGWD